MHQFISLNNCQRRVTLKTTPEATPTLGLTNQHSVDENQAPETNQLSASKIYSIHDGREYLVAKHQSNYLSPWPNYQNFMFPTQYLIPKVYIKVKIS